MWLLYFPLLAALASIDLPSSTSAFPLNYTVSRQCTPLNVTWKAVPEAFPYTVWILANHGFVQTFRINSDYQPGSEDITFQYVVPPPSAGFTFYTVTVGDSRGNGNTTQTLGITTPPESTSNCPAYTGSAAFTYAADAPNGSMIQCGDVRFYNIGDRGTKPFTISLVPLGKTPVSIRVPDSATLNISNFQFQSLVPFAEGTQFQTVLGDASGPGSGGASEIFTVGPSTDSPSCLASEVQLPGKLPIALPIANNVATFSNLAGAIPTSGPHPSSGSSHQTGAIAGGAIGGAIALGVAIGCLIAFLLYRRRQKAKREMARSEEVRFVDLDGDDDEDWAGAQRTRSSRRNGPGGGEDGQRVQSSYTVSPFVHEPRHHSGSSYGGSGTHGQSLETTSPISTNPSYGDLLSAAGLSSSAGVSPSDDYPPRPGNLSAYSRTSQDQFASRATGIDRDGTGLASDTLRGGSSSSVGLHSAPAAARSPCKARATAEQARRDARAPRRVVQHSDGGPLPQPSSDTEDEEVVDELPPEYGGWLQTNPAGAAAGSNVQRAPSHSGPYGTAQQSIPPAQSYQQGGASEYVRGPY
ncbi:uncharacterized protein UDID_01276 [Ustilago sp. UG-2017a]|nr:uncharacterized protein UDID_01276 [Ustilago sp. UG-2017a]